MKLSFKNKQLKFLDGYVEGPMAHSPFATSTEKENEFFMQWSHPIKLHRVAIRTPLGYRITYGFAEDVWNNNLGVIIPEKPDISEEISKNLIAYLKSREWFREMEKFTGFLREQGQAVLLFYHEDFETFDDLEKPIEGNPEILGVEAFNYTNYDIITWDDFGDPELFNITFQKSGPIRGASVRVHKSRLIHFVDKNIYRREKGHSILSVCYDSLVILSNIMKGAGEAAYRWGTGHPLILTKDLTDEVALNKMKQSIGTPTRRSWHILPSEYIDSFTMIGQAGQMLNLKSMADMVIDEIVGATGIPRPILLGEVAGVVTGSEVNERSYFALLDKVHTDLEPVVREYFNRDVNIRKLLYKYPLWELDWGLREVLSKQDAIEIRQKEISNTLALTSIITIDEAREELGFPPIGPTVGGDIILGLSHMYAPEQTYAQEGSAGTDKQTNSTKNADSISYLKDAIEKLRGIKSVDEICEIFNISPKTFYKIEEGLKNAGS